MNKREIAPRVLFKNKVKKRDLQHNDRNKKLKININIEEMNLEILLLNTLTINATKVQTVINEFMQDELCTNIFCFTETKVENLNFKPIGLKIFSKQRHKREKKGGGLMIGYKEDRKITMEEINVESNDILAIEGLIRGCKTRIILVYMDSNKQTREIDFKRNRKLQAQAENLL